jgi:hypothetical protein
MRSQPPCASHRRQVQPRHGAERLVDEEVQQRRLLLRARCPGFVDAEQREHTRHVGVGERIVVAQLTAQHVGIEHVSQQQATTHALVGDVGNDLRRQQAADVQQATPQLAAFPPPRIRRARAERREDAERRAKDRGRRRRQFHMVVAEHFVDHEGEHTEADGEGDVAPLPKQDAGHRAIVGDEHRRNLRASQAGPPARRRASDTHVRASDGVPDGGHGVPRAPWPYRVVSGGTGW